MGKEKECEVRGSRENTMRMETEVKGGRDTPPHP